MQVRVITTISDFDEAKDEWLRFEADVGNTNITSSYLWLRKWWEIFGSINSHTLGFAKRLCILFLYDSDGSLLAIAPFCIVRRKLNRFVSYRAIEFIGQQWAATYLDFISSQLTSQEINSMYEWLSSNVQYDVIDIRYIPENSICFRTEKAEYTGLSACPELTGSSYEEVRKKYYSRNLKHKLNRIYNKIERDNPEIRFDVAEGISILKQFDQIESVSVSKEASDKHSLYRDGNKADFMKGMIESFADNSKCMFMYYKDSVCAYNLGFYYGNKYFAIDAAYSRNIKELENLSIGNLTYDKLIESTITSSTSSFCFGAGLDSYKLRFSKEVCRIFNSLEKGKTLKSKSVFSKLLKKNRIVEKEFQKRMESEIPSKLSNHCIGKAE